MRISWKSGLAGVGVLLSLLVTVPARGGNLAEIFVYVQHYTPARSWFPVSLDGVPVAEIKSGRFFEINVSPGRHMVSGKKGVPVFVDARPGKNVFVRLEWQNGVLRGPILPTWEVVDRATAHNRSEERRVGKECRSRWSPCRDNRKA